MNLAGQGGNAAQKDDLDREMHTLAPASQSIDLADGGPWNPQRKVRGGTTGGTNIAPDRSRIIASANFADETGATPPRYISARLPVFAITKVEGAKREKVMMSCTSIELIDNG